MPEKPDKKPDPEMQNIVFVNEVRRLYPGVIWTEEKPVARTAAMGPIPKEEGAGTFYTFLYEDRQAVVEWRAKEGFYVNPKRQKEFGKDAKCVLMNPFMAAKRVVEILGKADMIGIV
jgi:hypothetical protein